MNSLKSKFGKFAVSAEKMAMVKGGWTCWTRAGNTFSLPNSISADDLLAQFDNYPDLAGCSN